MFSWEEFLNEGVFGRKWKLGQNVDHNSKCKSGAAEYVPKQNSTIREGADDEWS